MLKARGYYVLALRMPGHGTVPAGLTDVTWEDWLAAVRLGVAPRARDDRSRQAAGAGRLLERRRAGAEVRARRDRSGPAIPQAARIVLLSPMIGVAPFAWLARVISMLGPVPYFEKARWLDVIPNTTPSSTTPFPPTPASQTWRLTTTRAGADRAPRRRRARIAAAAGAHVPVAGGRDGQHRGRGAAICTISSPTNGSELVLFDINRSSGLEPFIRAVGRHAAVAPDRRVAAPLPAHARHQRRSVVARRGRAIDRARRGRSRHAAARARLAARDVLARRTSRCRFHHRISCMDARRFRIHRRCCGWGF